MGFELDGRGGHFEGLSDGADFDGDGDGCSEAYGEAEVRHAGGTETGFLGIDVVCAGGEGGDIEEAGGVSGSAGSYVGFEIADGDRHGGHDGTGGIGDGSGDGGSFALSQGHGGEEA